MVFVEEQEVTAKNKGKKASVIQRQVFKGQLLGSDLPLTGDNSSLSLPFMYFISVLNIQCYKDHNKNTTDIKQ